MDLTPRPDPDYPDPTNNTRPPDPAGPDFTQDGYALASNFERPQPEHPTTGVTPE